MMNDDLAKYELYMDDEYYVESAYRNADSCRSALLRLESEKDEQDIVKNEIIGRKQDGLAWGEQDWLDKATGGANHLLQTKYEFYNMINKKYGGDRDAFARKNNAILPDLLFGFDGEKELSTDEVVKRTGLTNTQGAILDAADGWLDGVVHKDVFSKNFVPHGHTILAKDFEEGMMGLSKQVLLDNINSDNPRPELTEIYNSFDTDKDGQVSDEEFKTGIEELSKKHAELEAEQQKECCNDSPDNNLEQHGQNTEQSIG